MTNHGPQPMGSPGQPQYGYQPPMGPPMMINRRLIFVVIGFGVILIWISALLLRAFTVTDPGMRSAAAALFYTGATIGFGGALLGALASPRTDGWQNLGLLILAAVFLLAGVAA